MEVQSFVHTSAASMEKAKINAVNKVINTAELLENILIYVPPQQVVLLQKVNKTFYNQVRGSTKIARELHLSPKKHNTATKLVFSTFGGQRGNACLRHSVALFSRVFGTLYLGSIRQDSDKPGSKSGYMQTVYIDVSRQGAREDIGSCGPLLVSQPAIYKITAEIWPRAAREDTRKLLQCDSGITLGFIVQAAKAEFDEGRGEVEVVRFIAEEECECNDGPGPRRGVSFVGRC